MGRLGADGAAARSGDRADGNRHRRSIGRGAAVHARTVGPPRLGGHAGRHLLHGHRDLAPTGPSPHHGCGRPRLGHRRGVAPGRAGLAMGCNAGLLPAVGRARGGIPGLATGRIGPPDGDGGPRRRRRRGHTASRPTDRQAAARPIAAATGSPWRGVGSGDPGAAGLAAGQCRPDLRRGSDRRRRRSDGLDPPADHVGTGAADRGARARNRSGPGAAPAAVERSRSLDRWWKRPSCCRR